MFGTSKLKIKDILLSLDPNEIENAERAIQRIFERKEFADPNLAVEQVFSETGFSCKLAKFRASIVDNKLDLYFHFSDGGIYRDPCLVLSNLEKAGFSGDRALIGFSQNRTTRYEIAKVSEICDDLRRRRNIINEVTKTRRKTCRC